MGERDGRLSEELLPEVRKLVARIQAQEAQADRLRALAEKVDAQTARDRSLLEDLESALGLAPQLRIDDVDGRLRGQRLREVAIQVLTERYGRGAEIHYRQWFQLLHEAGHSIGGKNPLATFLAQISRAPDIEAVGNRTGKYRLRAAA